jgi:hypothetical protein
MPVSDAVRREYERKLEPASMAVQLMRAGSLITGYELAKRIILENVRGFFGPVDDEYDGEVLARDRKSEFRANVAWLIEAGALDEAQAATLEELHSHRHQIVHELPAYLVDPDSEVRMDLLTACQSILRSLAVFWGRITIDTDPAFDGRDVLDDDIQSGASALFDHLLQVMIVIEQSMVRQGEVPTSPGSRPNRQW